MRLAIKNSALFSRHPRDDISRLPSRNASNHPTKYCQTIKKADCKSLFHQVDRTILDKYYLHHSKRHYRAKMGGRDDAGTPDPAEKGFATLATLRYGKLVPILTFNIYERCTFYGRIYLLCL